MAERRMFYKPLVQRARFVKMSVEARLLYYELGMCGDDDGFAEGYLVTRAIGVEEDALWELEKMGYLEVLNDDLLVHITDWRRNNAIRADRYHPSFYLTEFPQYARNAEQPSPAPQPCKTQPDAKDDSQTRAAFQPDDTQTTTTRQPTDNQTTTTWQPSDNQAVTTWQPSDNQAVTNRQPSDNHLYTDLSREVRLGKVRLVEDRLGKINQNQSIIGQNRLPPPAPPPAAQSPRKKQSADSSDACTRLQSNQKNQRSEIKFRPWNEASGGRIQQNKKPAA